MTAGAESTSRPSGPTVPDPHPALAYRPEVDGLRALAVLPVLLFHAKVAGFAGGFIGVDVFFVISGYLITGILLSNLRWSSPVFRFALRVAMAISVGLLSARWLPYTSHGYWTALTIAVILKPSFSLTRQLAYSNDQTRRALDLALFVNGLPVATLEPSTSTRVAVNDGDVAVTSSMSQ